MYESNGRYEADGIIYNILPCVNFNKKQAFEELCNMVNRFNNHIEELIYSDELTEYDRLYTPDTMLLLEDEIIQRLNDYEECLNLYTYYEQYKGTGFFSIIKLDDLKMRFIML